MEIIDTINGPVLFIPPVEFCTYENIDVLELHADTVEKLSGFIGSLFVTDPTAYIQGNGVRIPLPLGRVVVNFEMVMLDDLQLVHIGPCACMHALTSLFPFTTYLQTIGGIRYLVTEGRLYLAGEYTPPTQFRGSNGGCIKAWNVSIIREDPEFYTMATELSYLPTSTPPLLTVMAENAGQFHNWLFRKYGVVFYSELEERKKFISGLLTAGVFRLVC